MPWRSGWRGGQPIIGTLGLLSDSACAQRWATERQAYLAEGIRPIEQATDADRVLIETQERQGTRLDMMEIERLAAIVLG